MAQVDFSNAVLRPNTGHKPFNFQNFMEIANANYMCKANGVTISTNHVMTVLENTKNKYSVLFTGTFTESGTECYLHNYLTWKITNISFSAGDSYSFAIDIETTIG